MDFNKLVEAIAARVAQQIALVEQAQSPRAGLLVLTACHGTCCHELLESPRLAEKFATDCALTKNYECNLDDYEAVVVYSMSGEALFQIAEGIGGTPFTTLAVRAILAGKKVYMVRDEVELFSYKETAPPAYYAAMLGRVALLEASGVIFCESGELEDTLLGSACAAPACTVAACPRAEKALAICKKVLTERDLSAAYADRVTTVKIGAKTILTDLARDYARERNIQIVRE